MALPANISPPHQPDPATPSQGWPGSHERGEANAEPSSKDAEPGQPDTEPSHPNAEPGQPGAEPASLDAEPGSGGTKPGSGNEPDRPRAEPGLQDARPSASDTEPEHAATAQRLPGVPRLFFPDQPGQADQAQADQAGQASGQPYGQPRGSLIWAPGQQTQRPGQPGQPTGWQQRGGAQRPSRPRSTRPPERELRQRAIAALVFGALSLVALLGLGGDLRRGVYLLIFSAIVGVAACVIGITALRKARRTGVYRPRGAIGGIVLGALAALLAIPMLATYLAFPTQVNNYVKCLNLAQTPSEQRACQVQFFRSLHLSAGLHRVTASPAGQLSSGAERSHGSTDGPLGRLGGSSSAASPAQRSR